MKVTIAKRFKLSSPPRGLSHKLYLDDEVIDVDSTTAAWMAKEGLVKDPMKVFNKAKGELEKEMAAMQKSMEERVAAYEKAAKAKAKAGRASAKATATVS